MKRAIIFLLLMFNYNIFSQKATESPVAFLPHGLSLPLLNGNGNSAINNDVANIGSINPAALENFNNFMFGFSYQYEPKINESWIADIGSERINNWIPQSAGIVFPYNELRFAISMNQKYNRALLIGPMEITTIENPSGIGEFIKPKDETFIYNYSFTTSYTYNNFLSNSELSFGIRFGFYKLDEYEKIFNSWIDASLYSNDVSVGILYSSPKTDNQYLKLGIFYHSKLQFNEQVEILRDEVQIDNGGLFPTPIYPTEANLVAKFPSSIQLDIDFTQLNKFQFLASISNSYWSDVADNYKNQIEITSSISYFLSESFSPSFGFAYSEKKLVEDYFGANKKLDVIFLTAGAVLKFNNLSVNLALADSHLFSGDFRKTTIGKISLSYSL
ncbi:MAG: hypothetical protein KKF62_17265 [Bacteroidetes bacterium]|nr:hypothetical protein [Bacteroidota bacterium]MBU1115379.1 hypothetical protein [Bacteroidota bacterium]MBU1797900.1 hypothetical protein [Bacteroidota bacterium]